MCGASVRASSGFCPQCGGDLFAREKTAEDDAGPSSVTDEAEAEAKEISPRAVAPSDGERLDTSPEIGSDASLPSRGPGTVPPTRVHNVEGFEGGRAEPPRVREQVRFGSSETGADDSPEVIEALDDETRDDEAGGDEGDDDSTVEEGRRVRAAARVREVKQSLKPRVEKMREDALIVLDETPDDAGLRFVIIAAVLFILFVVFLIVSVYVLG